MKSLSLIARTLMIATAVVVGTATVQPADARQNPIQNQSRSQVANAVLDFTLHNATGYDIEAIYIGPSEQDHWGENLISETLSDGGSIDWSFDPAAEATEWDLRIDFADDEEGHYVYWKHLSLDEIASMTLHYDEDSGETSATYND